MLSPAEIMQRLEDIEHDLGLLQNEWAEASEAMARLKRDYELRQARALMATPADLKVDERKAQALIALAASEDGIYQAFAEAEGLVAGLRARHSVLETRASVGQSLLRAHVQEAGRPQTGPQPAWSANSE